MTFGEYLTLDRRNLFQEYPGKSGKGARFPMKDAKSMAFMVKRDLGGYNVLFVGKRVAIAFGVSRFATLKWHNGKDFNFAWMPHPSGINQWWNDQDNRAMGEDFLRRTVLQWRAGALTYG